MGIPWTLRQTAAKQIGQWKRLLIVLVVSGLLSISLMGCASRSQRVRLVELPEIATVKEPRRLSGSLSEVAPPAVLLDLGDLMSFYHPRVTITSPKSAQVIEQNRVEVKIKVKDFSIYKDEKLGLGPHLQVILDQQPARSVYSLEAPIIFEDLTPGSHTLQVVAVRPWGESFKNERAIAQTTFHVLAATGENTPDPNQPSLTYLEPQGVYSAEPVLIDFYLTNAPLHQVAQSSDSGDIVDWQIRCTINGQSFVVDQWQPIYIKGLTPGQNWVQLTLIDRRGNTIKNAFNSTVRTFIYAPEKRDALAKIVRGELSLEKVGQIAIANYEPPILPPLPAVEPTVEPHQAAPEPLDIPEAPENSTQKRETPTQEPQLEIQAPKDSTAPSNSQEDGQEIDDALSPQAPIDIPEVPGADAANDADSNLDLEPTGFPPSDASGAEASGAEAEASGAEIDTPEADIESVIDDMENSAEQTPEPDVGIFSQLRERVSNFFEKPQPPEQPLTTPPVFPQSESPVDSAKAPGVDFTEEQVESKSFQLDALDQDASDLDAPDQNVSDLDSSDLDNSDLDSLDLDGDALDSKDESDRSEASDEPAIQRLPEDNQVKPLPDTLSAPEPPEDLPENNLLSPSLQILIKITKRIHFTEAATTFWEK
ncbi:MAG: hypothetical protein AAGN15_12795 [Cyanobacteria bacterium J06581_3]